MVICVAIAYFYFTGFGSEFRPDRRVQNFTKKDHDAFRQFGIL